MAIQEKQRISVEVPEFPDVSFHEFDTTELDALDQMSNDNDSFFGGGGIYVSAFRKKIENKLSGVSNIDDRFYGGWLNGKLIGVASVSQYDESSVEIAGAVDQTYVRRGLAFAAGRALIQNEIDMGNVVVAEIENRNEDIVRPLLEKIDVGFSKERNTHDRRVVYSTPPVDEASLMRRLGL